MAVSFNTDILPLFTSADFQHMEPKGVHLNDHGWMSVPDNADKVYGSVSSGSMPPEQPWPDANIALFKSWMDGGYLP
jgi:hypothetical protein